MHLTLILLLGYGLHGEATAEDLLELGCTTDAHCAKFQSATCRDLRCICTAHGGEQRIDCQPKDEKVTNIIGGPCPCSKPHAECDVVMNQCFCAAGHMASADRRRCVPLQVALNGSCELSRQCQKSDTFAVCHMSQKRCMCKEHFEMHQGQCLALMDRSCSNDTFCMSIGSAFCLPEAQKCVCNLGLVPNHNMTACVPGAAHGANCTSPAECQVELGAGGTCHSNRCSCRIKHYARTKTEGLNGTVCEPLVPYGAYCRRNEDCHQLETTVDRVQDARMQCKWGECRCRDEFRVVDNEFCVLAFAAANQLDSFLPLPILFIWLIYSRVW